MIDIGSLPVHPQFKPEFCIGEEVWTISSRGEVQSSRIQKVEFKLCGEPDEAKLCCVGYIIQSSHSDTSNAKTFPQCDVYETEAMALEFAVWCPIVQMSEEDWVQAIGNPGDDDSIDASELYERCESVDAIRDFLWTCKENSGLLKRDVLKIIALMDLRNNWKLVDASQVLESPLQNVFSQLGIFPQKQKVN